MLQDAAQVGEICYVQQHLARKQNASVYVLPRRVWADNGHGNVTAYVDVIRPEKVGVDIQEIERAFPATTKNGQSLTVELTVRVERVGSDNTFEANATRFYDDIQT